MDTTLVVREGYQFSNSELRRIQLIELEMLVEVDRICRLNHIKYCISAGTQLGAIRHKGFIPWDDDADVAFLREEYEKFRIACEKDLDKERFYFQDYRNTKGYRWGYGKIRRKGTKFIRLNQESLPYEQGVFIDIMPYDNVPDRWMARKLHSVLCFLYRKCFWAPIGKRFAYGTDKIFLSMLSTVPTDKLYASYTKFYSRANRKKTKRVRINTLPVPGKENGYPRVCFEEIEPVLFENTMLYGMKDYDSYLSYKYGNYMEMPPVSMRKVHPVSSLVLEEKE